MIDDDSLLTLYRQTHELCALIGIDIGTAQCCVGVWRKGAVEIIPTDGSTNTTSSMVAFTDSGRLIGGLAKDQGGRNLGNTIFDIKKLIGRKFSDLPLQSWVKPWPFKVVYGLGDKPRIEIRHGGEAKELAPEEILSMIFTKLIEMAESHIKSKVGSAVCTVPVSFTIAQRQATRDAAAIAGLNSVTIISETSAAAIAYCMQRKCFNSQKKVLVFDLGASTCSATVLRIDNNKIEVKASFGDDELGGEHFVNNMVKYFVDKLERKKKMKINGDAIALRKLWNLCEKAKKNLSGNIKTAFSIDIGSLQVPLEISRAKFEQLNMHLFKKCMNLVEKCTREAGVSKSDVDEIVLVGGSTRIKKIEQLLSELFNGKKVYQSLNADEAVAFGATLHAACSSPADTYNEDNIYKLADVTPRTLGFEREDGLMTMMIPRNTTLPCKKVERVFTSGLPCIDKKTRVIKVYEGEEVRARDNKVVGELDVSWISSNNALLKIHVIESNVCFETSSDGALEVSWEDKKSKNKNKVMLADKVRLSEEEIRRMARRCDKYKFDDEKHQKIGEAKNALQTLAFEKKRVVEEKEFGGKPFSRAKKAYVLEVVEEVIQWLEDNQALELLEIEEKKKEFLSACGFRDST